MSFNWEALTDHILENADKAMEKTAKIFHGNIMMMFTGPYSQDALDAMDNPYAKRHGPDGGAIPNNPWWMINNQSGAMRRGLSFTSGTTVNYIVKFDTSVTPYAKYVFDGTTIMIKRDPLEMELLHLDWYKLFFRQALSQS